MTAIKKVEELVAWQRAREFAEAVNPVLDRPGFRHDHRLRSQLSDAVDSILANIAEGFEQPTDRAFAKYLYDAKGSTAETRTRLLLARNRRIITEEEFDRLNRLGDDVARIVNGLIKYLRKSDRRDRGLGGSVGQ